ncbi:MAG: 30S ribosomal protein THX [Chitinophagaceae bacterium]|nr:30S ribosomal protein THX [Chitinophagaceae bacterium]
MGRGDKKTKRGKIFKGSYGKHRLRTSRRLAAKRGKA